MRPIEARDDKPPFPLQPRHRVSVRPVILSVLLLSSVLLVLHSQVGDSDLKLERNAIQQPVPRTYFAMNLAGSAWKHPWPTMDVGAVRIFDSVWAKLEPQKGVWDFTHLDEDVANAQEHHADADLVLDSTPTWASARPTEANPYAYQTPGIRAEARDIADWETYVRTVAMRYKGRVHVYEMWNEPNMKDSYSGDPAHLVQLCKAAYRVLKQVDPSIRVISPSPAPGGGPQYLRSFIEQGGGDTFDILGYHFYDNLSGKVIHPESMVGAAQQLKRMLASLNLSDKPIWNTEAGYYIHSTPTAKAYIRSYPANIHVLSQGESVDAVARSYALAWAVGIERYYWYGWGEAAYAIVDDNGTTQKDATIAYAAITKWLLGATYQSVSHTPAGDWIIVSRTPQGKLQYIVWTNKDKELFTVPKEWKVSQVDDLSGAHAAISPPSIDLTGTPRLLHE
jgi:hypothetical protein